MAEHDGAKAHGNGKRKQRVRKKATPPPQPLEPRTKPSKRNAEGLPRCQRWKMRDGQFWQCPKPARAGFRNCGMHGAGHAKREREGTRQNPAVAAMVTGALSKPETVKHLLHDHPELGPLFAARLNSPSLLDPREFLALAQTMLDRYVQTVDLKRTEADLDRGDPGMLRAIAAAERIVGLAERCVSLEQKLGPVTRAELERMSNAVIATLSRFLPADRAAEATEFCRAHYLGELVPARVEDGHEP